MIGEVIAPGLPRYHQLTRILQQRIEDGTYPVAGMLPTEIELGREFSVSRHTIREALRRLTDSGLVARRQGSGTQVIATKPPTAYVQSMRLVSELFQYAADTQFTIWHMEEIEADDNLSQLLGHPDCQRWLKVEGMRSEPSRQPLCRTQVYFHESLIPLREQLADYPFAFYTLIEKAIGEPITTVIQEFAAEPMPKGYARQLRSSTKVWAVRVLRRYMGADGRPLQVSVNYYPADRFSYSMELRREDLK